LSTKWQYLLLNNSSHLPEGRCT